MVAKAKDKDPKKKSGKKAAAKDGKKDKDVMSRREKRTIPVKLDDKEIAKHAKDYANTRQKIELLEGEKKAADDKFKGDIKLLEGAAAELLGYIRTGERERELEVDVTYDWKSREVRVVRVDTKETITKRTMTAEEAQREMYDVDHRKDKGEVKDVSKKGDGKRAEKKNPEPNDVIDVETLNGWMRGKVLPSSGSVLNVQLFADSKTVDVPVESELWRWPDEVGENAAPTRNLPGVGDTVQAKGYDGLQEGKVSKIDGKKMTVDIGDDEVIEVDIDGDDWRWPDTLKASVGEQVEAKEEAKAEKGKRKKKGKGNGTDEIAPMPGEEGLDF